MFGVYASNHITVIRDGITYYDEKTIAAILVFGAVFFALTIACLFCLKVIGCRKYKDTDQIEELDSVEYDEAADEYVYGVGMRLFFIAFAAVFLTISAVMFVHAATANTMNDYHEKYGDEKLEVTSGDGEIYKSIMLVI